MADNKEKQVNDKSNLVAVILAAIAAYIEAEQPSPQAVSENKH